MDRFLQRLGARVAATPDGPIPGPIADILADPSERYATWLDYVVIVVILFDMVVKPFS